MTTIYLDHQATTPVDPRVLEAMLPWMAQPANPHAAHAAGRRAAEAVETARRQVAELVGVDEREVFFTGGATEAANIALRSLPAGTRVLSNRIEHACVLETLQALQGRLDVHFADVDGDGMLDPDEFADRLDGVDAVVAMAVNNEIGTVQPLVDIAAACSLADVDLLTDVTQAVGRIPLDLTALSVRAAWLSSHKIYGPQGIGALIWRGEPAPKPLATGGGQERGIRPGTVPTALAVGFGAACEIAGREMEQDARHAAALAERMFSIIRQSLPDAIVNGSREHRVPHNLNVAFPGIDADALVGMLPGLAISTGSACSSGALGLSHVLTTIATDEVAASSIRMGFGRTTTVAEVDAAAKMISEAVDALVGGTLRKVG